MKKQGRNLAAECDITFFRSGGPGGQHRNKTETGVRLYHRPTGLKVQATERRSQSQNKSLAFKRLEKKLDILNEEVKERVPTEKPESVTLARLKNKALNSDKKKMRRSDNLEVE